MTGLESLGLSPSHVLRVYAAFWTLSALAHTMPAPDAKTGKGYQWVYNLLQFLLANFGKLQGFAARTAATELPLL